MRPGTVSQLSRERQVSRTRVYQWLEEGKIVRLDDGRIDLDDANTRLQALLDQSKGIRRDGNITSTAPVVSSAPGSAPPAGDGQRGLELTTPGVPADSSADIKGSRDDQTYWQHRTESEKYDSLRKKALFLRDSGALTVADEVRQERAETARSVRNALLGMVDRVAPVLDPANPARAHKLLTSEVQKALIGLQNELERRAGGAPAVSGEPAPALQ